MLIRGSAQLLLLFFRSRPRLGWLMAGTAFILVLATLARAGEFPTMMRTGLAQLLRQTAWEHALAKLPEQAPWPWAETSAGANGTVSQLGLSAAVIKEGETGGTEDSAIGPIRRAAARDPHLPPPGADGAGIGDLITVTTADGATQAYRVTGGNVIDLHLADIQRDARDEDSAPATCLPLVLQSRKAKPSAQPEPGPEHKL